MTQPNVTPSQEAREAAEDAYYTCFEQEPNRAWLDALLAGRHDDDPVTQAFARFEQAIRRDEAEQCARVMENLCFFTDVDELLGMTKQEMSVRTCREGAAALRARHDGITPDAR